MWTDAHEDYLVMSLLRAVAGDEVAGAAYLALTGDSVEHRGRLPEAVR